MYVELTKYYSGVLIQRHLFVLHGIVVLGALPVASRLGDCHSCTGVQHISPSICDENMCWSDCQASFLIKFGDCNRAQS